MNHSLTELIIEVRLENLIKIQKFLCLKHIIGFDGLPELFVRPSNITLHESVLVLVTYESFVILVI